MANDSASLPIATMIHIVPIKLSSSNYLLWKKQFIPMLASFDLIGYIDGSVLPPSLTIAAPAGDPVAAPIPNPDYSIWKMTDQKLLGVLLSSLSEEAMAEVVDCSTAREAFLALESAFSHGSTSRALQLCKELLFLHRGNSTVTEYGRKFKHLCDQLSSIGRPVAELDKSHWFLRGLGPQFLSFSDTRMSMTPVLIFTDLLN